MPTYEYRCDGCGHEFEREQRITEDPIRTCPSCKARRARRLISRTSFVLKGSGWYSDLYASPGAKPETKKADSEKGGETKTSEDKGSTGPSDASKTEKAKPGKEKSGKEKPAKGKSRSAA